MVTFGVLGFWGFGVVAFVAGVIGAITVTFSKYLGDYQVGGWASLFSLVLIIGGAVLLALGIIAEYLGVLVRRSIGLPLYVIGNDPHHGPLHKQR